MEWMDGDERSMMMMMMMMMMAMEKTLVRETTRSGVNLFICSYIYIIYEM
jgi:hypothetical protein